MRQLLFFCFKIFLKTRKMWELRQRAIQFFSFRSHSCLVGIRIAVNPIKKAPQNCGASYG
jgi:hypothetical protein